MLVDEFTSLGLIIAKNTPRCKASITLYLCHCFINPPKQDPRAFHYTSVGFVQGLSHFFLTGSADLENRVALKPVLWSVFPFSGSVGMQTSPGHL